MDLKLIPQKVEKCDKPRPNSPKEIKEPDVLYKPVIPPAHRRQNQGDVCDIKASQVGLHSKLGLLEDHSQKGQTIRKNEKGRKKR